MVHIVLLDGDAQSVTAAEALLMQAASGYIRVKPQVWLASGQYDSQAWRDFLTSQVPGVTVIMAQLSGSWASKGINAAADWLKDSSHAFGR